MARHHKSILVMKMAQAEETSFKNYSGIDQYAACIYLTSKWFCVNFKYSKSYNSRLLKKLQYPTSL